MKFCKNFKQKFKVFQTVEMMLEKYGLEKVNQTIFVDVMHNIWFLNNKNHFNGGHKTNKLSHT